MKSNYTTRVFIAAPIHLASVCVKIGKAFDPDVGGERTFYRVSGPHKSQDGGDNSEHLVTQFYALPEFAASLKYLMFNPEQLYQTCARDYEKRWRELSPPTLAECKSFTEQAILEIKGENHLISGELVIYGQDNNLAQARH